MKLLIFLVTLGLISIGSALSQSANPLAIEYIDELTFKLEAGTLLTYDTVPLTKEKYIFVMDDQTGYIRKDSKRGKYIYFKPVKTTKTDLQITKDFVQKSPKGIYRIRLNLTKVKETSSTKNWTGTLRLQYGSTERTVKVHGIERL